MRTRRSPAGGGLRRLPPALDAGVTLPELLLVVALIAGLSAVTWPGAAAALDRARVRHAARGIATAVRAVRYDAIHGGRRSGLVFDSAAGHWVMTPCVDEDADGVSRADVASGVDLCEAPVDLDVAFPGVRVAVDATLQGPSGEPGSSDAIRFGANDLVSCSPAGDCTAGSIYLRSVSGTQYVVRVAGVSGRTRVLWYDPPARAWRSD